MFIWQKLGPMYEGDGTGGPGGTPPGGNTPVAAPWAAAANDVWKVGEGDKAVPWYATIADEPARKHVEAKGYKTPAELATANYNLTRLQTGDPNIINLPGKDAKPEAWTDVYTKLGRPAAPDKYEFKFPAEFKADEGMLKFAKDTFFAAGLNGTQAQAVADKWNAFAAESNAAAIAAEKTKNDDALLALTQSWGPDLEKNRAAGHRVVQSLGLSNESVQALESAIGSAAIVEMLAKIGRKSDEGGFTGGSGTYDANNPETMNKEQAQARIKELRGDPTFEKAYTDKNDPLHAEKVKLMERLFARS